MMQVVGLITQHLLDEDSNSPRSVQTDVKSIVETRLYDQPELFAGSAEVVEVGGVEELESKSQPKM